jgi:hypothetical protein
MNKQLLYIAAMVSAVAGVASAQNLVSWENDHLVGNELTTVAGEVPSAGSWHFGLASAPVLARGAGATGTSFGDTFAMRNANAVSLTDAIAANRYLTFTIEAATGNLLNLSGITALITAQNATNYTVSVAVMTNLTGFAAGDALGIWSIGGTGNVNDWLGQSRTLDLSGVSALQSVPVAEFRLYVYGQSGAWDQVGIGRSFQTNGATDLAVQGSVVPVPEPTLFGALAGGLALLLGLRRRVR